VQDEHRRGGHGVGGHGGTGGLHLLAQGAAPAAEGEPGVQLGGEDRRRDGDQGVGEGPRHGGGERGDGDARGEADRTAAQHETDEGGEGARPVRGRPRAPAPAPYGGRR
jgi:hypothetical protein